MVILGRASEISMNKILYLNYKKSVEQNSRIKWCY